MRAFVRAAVVGAVVVAAACTGNGGSRVTTLPTTAVPTSTDSSLGVVRTCCPRTDAEIWAMIAEYERTPPAERSPELALLGHRHNSGIDTRSRTVVTDSEGWAALWAQIIRGNSPQPPVPRVDFNREMLIVVGMGVRPTGGYQITIDSVRAINGRVRAYVTEWSPGRLCGVTGAITEPVGLARLRRVTMPVEFVERARVFDCG
jgi:hypothetical protein